MVRDEADARGGADAPALLILDGPRAGTRVSVDAELVVGRGGEAGFDVDDHEVSRRHARFRREGDRLEVTDLGSTNGTWVNGSQIADPASLRPDDVIKVGTTHIRVVCDPAGAAAGAAVSPVDARGAPGTSDDATPAGRDLLGPQEDELRPVTALFADIVGSTSIGEHLRPDEVKTLVGECVTRISRIIEQYGGVIDAYMGDGIAAFFGVPAAREDDVERGARAALRIVEQMERFAADVRANWSLPAFDIRVGMNTGQVAVGVVGAGKPQAVALGDTTNVAARLQAVAEPGTVVVGGRTAQELRDRFLLEPLGDITVKGRTAPVEAWRLVRAEMPPETSETRPFVNRARETKCMKAAIDRLVSGRGQVLVIVGDPGIGKTRLLDRLRDSTRGRATWLAGSCALHATRLSDSPFSEILRRWLGNDPTEDAAQTHSRLTTRLEQLLGKAAHDVVPSLASLLSVGDESDHELHDVSAEQVTKDIRAAYCTWARALSDQGPLIFAVEDFHWAGRPTRELADSLLEVVESSPLLLAATFRAEPESEGWRFRRRAIADYAHCSLELQPGPLSEEHASELLDLLVPEGLDPSAKDQLIRRADGNPLYLEQLLSLFQETGELRRDSGTWAMTVVQHELPSALESLLIARIDALPSAARRVIQTAAIVGRDFSPRLVAATVGGDGFPETIRLLLDKQIISELRSVPEVEYEFTHALIREAALSTLPRSRRRDMYRAVSAAIERIYGDSLDAHLEQLAYYNARAGDLSRALWYLTHAAERAAAVQAYRQAAEMWKRAADLAERIGDVDARRRIARELWQLGEGQA